MQFSGTRDGQGRTSTAIIFFIILSCFRTVSVIAGIGSVFHGSYHTEVSTSASQTHLLVPSCPSEINSYNTVAKFTNECKYLKCSLKQIVRISFQD